MSWLREAEKFERYSPGINNRAGFDKVRSQVMILEIVECDQIENLWKPFNEWNAEGVLDVDLSLCS